MELHEALERVSDQESFLAFARLLVLDRERAVELEAKSPSSPLGPDAGGWANINIESFLAAAIAWAESTNFGTSKGLQPSEPWRQFAVFLYCGKIYE